jgi:hypothetical protein
LDFFKKRIRQYQEKKLNEILSNIQFHQNMKKHLEQEIERINDNEQNKTRKEISYHDKMLNIWKKNEEKLRKQMSEMDD